MQNIELAQKAKINLLYNSPLIIEETIMSSFFVTGTDTNVGKTVCSRAIIQALKGAGVQVVGYKPIACTKEEPIYTTLIEQNSDYGNLDNDDVAVLLNSTQQNLSYQDINSYTFNHNLPMISPDYQRIDVDKINADLARLTQQYQAVVVEGSLGWMTPLTKTALFCDWVKAQNMPVVLVVGIKEGCINHALLTARSVQQMGIPLLGWIANRINPCLAHYSQIIDFLIEHIDAPLLGQIPYIHKPEEQDVGRFITELDRLTMMKTELVK